MLREIAAMMEVAIKLMDNCIMIQRERFQKSEEIKFNHH